MSIKAWFPTFIYYEQLSAKNSEKFNRELLKECYQIRDYDDPGRAWSRKCRPWMEIASKGAETDRIRVGSERLPAGTHSGASH